MAHAATASSRKRGGQRDQPTLGQRVDEGCRRLSTWSLITIAIGLGVMLFLLASVGDPPWLRIDPLWVKGHRAAVRGMIVAGAVAMAASIVLWLPGVGRRPQRWLSVAFWAVALGAVGKWYWSSAWIIIRTLVDRYT